ncbi:hypothetical protein BTN98_17865 [Photobacterium aquimaris]|uniref:Uncharacterized protein n=1 Tax=Photobacterium aquimaris TaxID=512643 RepID=A0A2T3I0X2_9GAMM|nr:hypothetical protein AYY21_08925 [Photobacterium aquimaris]PQJ37009.1 hypothetical protein BTN98_17865 [Photobacterium aquimaris]PSU10136.1 hypothetical protein C0W81_05270 [Photobacterium aquimaris]
MSNLRKEIVFNHVDEIQQILYIKTHVHVGKYDAELGAIPYVIVPEVMYLSVAHKKYFAQYSSNLNNLTITQTKLVFVKP